MDKHGNPPLQPVTINEDTTRANKLILHPHLPSQPLTTDDLWSMWNIATKAKSSINQGQRLENLSWRLWYSTTATHTTDNKSKQHQQLDPTLARTCSSILLEIQEAANHGDPFSRSFASDDSDCGNVAAAVGELLRRDTTTSPPASPIAMAMTMDQSTLTASCVSASGSGKSTNEYLARKKKKNVERYMRKYQKRLEGILEEREPNLNEVADFTDLPEDSLTLDHKGSSMSTTAESQPDTPNHDGQDDLFTRRTTDDLHSPKSSLSDKPSLLSRLLSRVRPVDCCGSTPEEHHTPRPLAPIPRPCPAICMCEASSLDLEDLEDDFMDCL